MILRWATILFNIGAAAFIGLLAGALLAVVGNIVGGSPRRILITTIAGAVIGTVIGVAGIIRSTRRGGWPARSEPYLAILRGAAPDDEDGRANISFRNGGHEEVRG